MLLSPLSPRLREVCPQHHHLPAEPLLVLRVVEARGVERLPEHEGDLVPVQDAAPLGPRVLARAVVEVVLVDLHGGVDGVGVSGRGRG